MTSAFKGICDSCRKTTFVVAFALMEEDENYALCMECLNEGVTALQEKAEEIVANMMNRETPQ